MPGESCVMFRAAHSPIARYVTWLQSDARFFQWGGSCECVSGFFGCAFCTSSFAKLCVYNRVCGHLSWNFGVQQYYRPMLLCGSERIGVLILIRKLAGSSRSFD